jgi:hypothetical protein
MTWHCDPLCGTSPSFHINAKPCGRMKESAQKSSIFKDGHDDIPQGTRIITSFAWSINKEYPSQQAFKPFETYRKQAISTTQLSPYPNTSYTQMLHTLAHRKLYGASHPQSQLQEKPFTGQFSRCSDEIWVAQPWNWGSTLGRDVFIAFRPAQGPTHLHLVLWWSYTYTPSNILFN